MNLDSYIIHVESTDVNGNIVIDKLAYGFYLIDEDYQCHRFHMVRVQ